MKISFLLKLFLQSPSLKFTLKLLVDIGPAFFQNMDNIVVSQKNCGHNDPNCLFFLCQLADKVIAHDF